MPCVWGLDLTQHILCSLTVSDVGTSERKLPLGPLYWFMFAALGATWA